MHSSSPWPAADGLWLGLAALGGLIIPLGEGQMGSSRDSSCYRLSHITLGCQSLQESFGMPWRRTSPATPSSISRFPGEAMADVREGVLSTVVWSNVMTPSSTSPCFPVLALAPPCHRAVSCFPVPAGPGCCWAGCRAVPPQRMSQQRGFFFLKSCLAAYGNNKSSIIFNGEADGLDDWFDF